MSETLSETLDMTVGFEACVEFRPGHEDLLVRRRRPQITLPERRAS